MRFGILQFFLLVALVSLSAAAEDVESPIYFTNQPAISSGRVVLTAVISGDAQSRSNVQALIGSQVVFVGGKLPGCTNADLIVWSNVVLEVDIRPFRDVRPGAKLWSSEVLGTLKAVDFKNRVIQIQAKPEDWMVRETL